ncbi:conserved phage C-terminal domain-containing protein [Neobacillus niacini]|uniref:conserved phage C-terminal domain-containing protein n=1 Tax=Neobacillus niacini TaxID=86668 RepID=UPI00285FC055|nr:conserved phage C-terminal domain-containing protein [Neobacillus niacini]MDR7001360.1 putative phage protein (TIGR02220 family) [Neobacillus niacini]
MSNLLVYENPMMVIPSLANMIGLNEAIVLQQLHYWVDKSTHIIEGRKWIYNTYNDWQEQFSFWSLSTIKRIFRSLEDQGLLLSGNWNTSKMDKTKWYTIEYERLEALELAPSLPKKEEPCNETEQVIEEIVTPASEKTEPVIEIIQYLNNKTNSAYRSSSAKTQAIIRTRILEGYIVDDFKKVIDLKAAEWLQDPYMSKYLRPETLFGPKFEAYLNQKPFKKAFSEEEFDLND